MNHPHFKKSVLKRDGICFFCLDWLDNMNSLKAVRNTKGYRWTDGRKVTEYNGEMALYYILNDPAKLPNRNALEFHKTACLIWRLAGGAESEEEYCSDDEDIDPIPTSLNKDIRQWIRSSSTLCNDEIY
jgi:hypothetical protein